MGGRHPSWHHQIGGIIRPSLARPGLSRPSISRGAACDAVARPDNNHKEEDAAGERAMEALNTAASLLRKDGGDARRLGMESLVLLTVPLKAGADTSRIASRVVLIGSPSAHAGRTADDDNDNGTMIDTLFEESSCGMSIRETILETIIGRTNSGEGKEKRTRYDADAPHHHGGLDGIEGEFTEGLFGLCLTALSNVMHAMDDPAVVWRFVDETGATTASSPPSCASWTGPVVRTRTRRALPRGGWGSSSGGAGTSAGPVQGGT